MLNAELLERGGDMIPKELGIQHFLNLVLNDPGSKQVIVTSRIWNQDLLQSRRSPVKEFRFLEGLSNCIDGVEGSSRVTLRLDKDLYLHDHKYAGSYLFPTVFAMEAMAQLAGHVIKQDEIQHIDFDMLEALSAIVVDPAKGTEIEINVEVKEENSRYAKLNANIRTENSKFKKNYFSSSLTIYKISRETPMEKIEHGKNLNLDVKQNFYGPLLFHGPTYQRLETFQKLTSNELLFKFRQAPSEYNQKQSFSDPTSRFILGDPFGRDALLQAGQNVTTRLITLPVSCLKWEIFSTESKERKLHGTYQLNSNDGKKLTHMMKAIMPSGSLIEKLTDCISVIVKEMPQNLRPEEMTKLAQSHSTESELVGLEEVAKTMGVSMEYRSFSGLSGMNKPERHSLEQELLRQTLEKHGLEGHAAKCAELDHRSDGKPFIKNLNQKMDCSFSHSNDFLFCMVSSTSCGCDLEKTEARTKVEWENLLGPKLSETLNKIVDSKNEADTNVVGTALWSAREAAFKASGNMELPISEWSEFRNGFQFFFANENTRLQVCSDFIKLNSKDQFLLSLATISPSFSETSNSFENLMPLQMIQNPEKFFSIEYNADKGFGARWPITFKDASSANRNVSFSKFFEWQGRARELAILPLLKSSGKIFSGSEYGWATNHSEVRIWKRVQVGDILEVKISSGAPKGRHNSSVDIFFDWYRIDGGAQAELVAQSAMMTTWVRVLSHASVEVAPFPNEFQSFFSGVARQNIEHFNLTPAQEIKELIYAAPKGVSTGPMLFEQSFDTTFEESNLVGNIYFSNYATWLGKTRDLFLHGIIPQSLNQNQHTEVFALRTKIQHLREAMPFDKILVSMRLKQLSCDGVQLYFDFYKTTSGLKEEKVATAEQYVIWSKNENQRIQQCELPAMLKYYFSCAIREEHGEITGVQSKMISPAKSNSKIAEAII